MPDETDFQNDQSDSYQASDSSGAGQSSDWEARFKGMQREFNKLKTQLEAKDKHNTQLRQELTGVKSQLTDLSTKYEGELSALRASEDTIKADFAKKESELATIQSELGYEKARNNVRREIVERHQELLPWFETGYLTVPEKDGAVLTGEELDTHLSGFKNLLLARSTQAVTDTLSGSVPPQFSTGTSTDTKGMSVDQMRNWLENPANFNSSDYDRVDDAYLSKLSK